MPLAPLVPLLFSVVKCMQAVAPVCDFHLDSTDHNAHSTGLDGLWAGVPLLTMPGVRFAARVVRTTLSTLRCLFIVSIWASLRYMMSWQINIKFFFYFHDIKSNSAVSANIIDQKIE